MSIEQAFNIKRKADRLIEEHIGYTFYTLHDDRKRSLSIRHSIISVEFALEHTHQEDVYKREELNLLLNELKSRL